MDLSHLISVFMLLCLTLTDALRFHLSPNTRKCLKEEIHKGVLVTGEYELSENPGQKTLLTVMDSKGQAFYNKEDASRGKFAFTTDEYDVFEVCFDSKVLSGGHGVDREVFLDMKHGVEAKNYADLAKAEKMKPLEVELKKLEDLADSIVNDFSYMRAREEEMRDTNESTHSKVLYFSIFSMCCLLGLATGQVLYLRKYFQAKKLIE